MIGTDSDVEISVTWESSPTADMDRSSVLLTNSMTHDGRLTVVIVQGVGEGNDGGMEGRRRTWGER